MLELLFALGRGQRIGALPAHDRDDSIADLRDLQLDVLLAGGADCQHGIEPYVVLGGRVREPQRQLLGIDECRGLPLAGEPGRAAGEWPVDHQQAAYREARDHQDDRSVDDLLLHLPYVVWRLTTVPLIWSSICSALALAWKLCCRATRLTSSFVTSTLEL